MRLKQLFSNPIGLARSNTFIRIVISYLVVIAVSVAVYASMYSYSFETVRNYILSTGVSGQDNAAAQINSILSSAETALIRLSSNYNMLRLQKISNPNDMDYMLLYAGRNDLSEYRKMNPDIKNLLIYFKNSDTICSDRFASKNVNLLFNSEFGCEGMSLDLLPDTTHPRNTMYFMPSSPLLNGNGEVITFFKKFPCTYAGRDASVAIVEFKSENIAKILRSGMLSESTASCLLDRNTGTFLLECKGSAETSIPVEQLMEIKPGYNEYRINGRRTIFFRSDINAYGLSCISAFDMNTLMVDTTHHKMILLSILLIALLLEIVYALIISRRRYRPIQKVLTLLQYTPEKSKGNELDSIYDSIANMNRESVSIRKQLSSQEETIRKLSLSKLLGLEPGMLESRLLPEQIPSNCEAHIVFIIYGSSSAPVGDAILECRACVDAITQKLRSIDFVANVIAFEYFLNSTACILSLMDQTKVNEVISQLSEYLFASKITLYSGIGLPVADNTQISRAFSEARLAAQEAKSTGMRVVLYQNLSSRVSSYGYSSEVENALSQYILSGNCEKALSTLNEVYWSTRESPSAPARLQLLLNDFYGTLLKIRQQNQLKSPVAEREFYFILNEIEFSTNLYQRYNAIVQAVQFYCEKIKDEKDSELPELCHNVTQYISEHYGNPDLTLEGLADRFNVNSKYLSRHFKEQIGMNISTFITNTRMKRAQELLLGSEILTSDLASTCGYANTNTFHKAFKRYWGMSPSAFKRMYQKTDSIPIPVVQTEPDDENT